MNLKINLISDTVTRPSPEMLQYMMSAEVGDDVFRQDPTVNKLEQKCAELFGHENALFCPSGTMSNQIAIKAHTQALDELLCEYNSHVYQYELGGYAFHSGLAVNPIISETGKLNPELIEQNVRAKTDWFPSTKLVVLENTGNRTGGNYYSLSEMENISEKCKSLQLNLHLDGARVFNAIVAAGYTSLQLGSLFDSISICLSKGLGAPVGSVLIGSEDFIARARKIRKVMGGGMRQAGYLAAAGIYALDHNIERLQTDHEHAALIRDCLMGCSYVESIKEVYTNIIIFNLNDTITTEQFLKSLESKGIEAIAFGPRSIRFVTHLDQDRMMIERVCFELKLLSS